MFNKYKFLWLSLLLVGFAACEDKFPDEIVIVPDVVITSGTADFAKYVAVGASFTAGFTDNALFIATQQTSFPNILASKMALAGGGSFTQPLMNDNIGGLLFSGNVIQPPRLYFNGAGPAVLPGTPTTEVLNILSGPFNNMGVPGAKSFHLLAAGYGNAAGVPTGQANPYFARMASSPGTTVLADVMAQIPTFFTMSEVGGNDVLGYALSGGTGVDRTGNPDATTYGGNDITDPGLFGQVFGALVGTLTSGGAKGVVANVPYITSLPHFTTVPYNPVPLDAGTAGALNQGYSDYNNGLLFAEASLLISSSERARRTINFAAGQNAVVIVDEDLTDLNTFGIPSYRHATAEDLLVLTSSSFIGTLADPNNPLSVNGVAVPLADKWVLTPEEQLAVKNATDAYNASIQAVASNFGVAVVDLNGILEEATSNGVQFDNFTMNTSLVFGGLIGLDGVHLTQRGYAYMANAFMAAIDDAYGSNLLDAAAKATDYVTNFPPGI